MLVSGFPLLVEWFRRTRDSLEECRQAISKPYDWDPKDRLIGYVPVRKVQFRATRNRRKRARYLFGRDDIELATLLQKRILQPEANGFGVSHKEHRAQCQSFKLHFGVDVHNVWGLHLLHNVEWACITQQNAELRRSNLNDEQQERFRTQSVPSWHKHAEHVLKHTTEAVADCPPGAGLPPEVNVRFTVKLMQRYGFDHGGGPNRKVSGATLAAALNRHFSLKTCQRSQSPSSNRLGSD
jgi:hypothetical protein